MNKLIADLTAQNNRIPIQWTDGKGNYFKIKAVYNPNEEPDPWVEYYNTQTLNTYSCRVEAFTHIFSRTPA